MTPAVPAPDRPDFASEGSEREARPVGPLESTRFGGAAWRSCADLESPSDAIVLEANDRCNQENLIAQLRSARAMERQSTSWSLDCESPLASKRGSSLPGRCMLAIDLSHLDLSYFLWRLAASPAALSGTMYWSTGFRTPF
jgi:hypothetical protein